MINYKGKEILYLDFSGCNKDEIFQIIKLAEKIIRVQPKKSLLTLTNVFGARYDKEIIRELKEFANNNKPFVKAGAVVGIEGLKKVAYDAVIKFTGRNLPAFDDTKKAKDWLAKQ